MASTHKSTDPAVVLWMAAEEIPAELHQYFTVVAGVDNLNKPTTHLEPKPGYTLHRGNLTPDGDIQNQEWTVYGPGTPFRFAERKHPDVGTTIFIDDQP